MPGSAEEGRALMVDRILDLDPGTVLDVGAGSGTYGIALRNLRPDLHLTALEVWAPYISRFKLRTIYNSVINVDVRKLTPLWWPQSDVVILGDVLEHMTAQDAQHVWRQAQRAARLAVFASIPIVHYPQGHEEGNPYEEHVVDNWTHHAVLEKFSGITWSWRGSIVGRYGWYRENPQ